MKWSSATTRASASSTSSRAQCLRLRPNSNRLPRSASCRLVARNPRRRGEPSAAAQRASRPTHTKEAVSLFRGGLFFVLDHCPSVGRGHPLRRLARLHASSPSAHSRLALASGHPAGLLLREYVACEDIPHLPPHRDLG